MSENQEREQTVPLTEEEMQKIEAEEELRKAKIAALKKERAAINARTKKELLELGVVAPKRKAPQKKPLATTDAQSASGGMATIPVEEADLDIDAKIKELASKLNAIKKEEKQDKKEKEKEQK